MSRVRKDKFLRCGVLLLAFLFLALALTQPTLALTSHQINLYGQNSIFFYDPNANCVDMNDEDDESSESVGWDGHCSDVSAYNSQIFKYFFDVYQVANSNGLPWEGLMAQLIGESSFMTREVCAFNPLGLKGEPSCDGKHRSFSNYDEAFAYYVNSIVPVRMARNRFANDPYGYVEFLINGVPGYRYATDPDYINKISSIVCGLQKWAQKNNRPISGVGSGGSSSGTVTKTGSSLYCNPNSGGGGGGGGGGADGLIFYLQCDSRWGKYMYGTGGINGKNGTSICASGCGPTSFAVIAANLKGDSSITPAKTADLAGKAGMHTKDTDGNWTGSSWGITSYLAGQYGLSASKISASISSINSYLDNGYMIHTSGSGSAPYTKSGHYIAIVKKLDNGKWLVGDSSGRGPSGIYDPATVISGMNSGNVWAVK